MLVAVDVAFEDCWVLEVVAVTVVLEVAVLALEVAVLALEVAVLALEVVSFETDVVLDEVLPVPVDSADLDCAEALVVLEAADEVVFAAVSEVADAVFLTVAVLAAPTLLVVLALAVVLAVAFAVVFTGVFLAAAISAAGTVAASVSVTISLAFISSNAASLFEPKVSGAFTFSSVRVSTPEVKVVETGIAKTAAARVTTQAAVTILKALRLFLAAAYLLFTDFLVSEGAISAFAA